MQAYRVRISLFKYESLFVILNHDETDYYSVCRLEKMIWVRACPWYKNLICINIFRVFFHLADWLVFIIEDPEVWTQMFLQREQAVGIGKFTSGMKAYVVLSCFGLYVDWPSGMRIFGSQLDKNWEVGNDLQSPNHGPLISVEGCQPAKIRLVGKWN